MFVRKKPNKSGSVSVQVVDKSHSRYRVVKSFGSSFDESEVERLCGEAELFIRRKTGMEYDLFHPAPEFGIDDFVRTLSNSHVSVVGPELVFGRLYDHAGFDALRDEMFRRLVLCRLFSPGSKLKAVDSLWRYMGIEISVSSVYRYMDRLCLRDKDTGQVLAGGVKEQVERITFERSRKAVGGNVEMVFYDISTLYFEASDEDELRRTGFSKDGKFDCPQIMLGLLITREGNPISYEIFEGSLSEKATFLPLLKRAAERYGLKDLIVVADAGLLSRKNIDALVEEGFEYILGARLRNEGEAVKREILGMGLEDGDVRSLCKADGTRIVVSRSEKRRRKDAHNRQKGLDRLRKRVGTGRLTKKDINNRGYNKYLRMEGSASVSIDMEAYERDAQWDGIKGYVTNTTLGDEEVIANYGHLWLIERAFRMSKTDLRVRPIYHRLRNRIEGHICISFAAYVIQIELERALKSAKSSITIDRAREIVKTMYALRYTLPHQKTEKTIILRMDEEQQSLYDLVMEWVSK